MGGVSYSVWEDGSEPCFAPSFPGMALEMRDFQAPTWLRRLHSFLHCMIFTDTVFRSYDMHTPLNTFLTFKAFFHFGQSSQKLLVLQAKSEGRKQL